MRDDLLELCFVSIVSVALPYIYCTPAVRPTSKGWKATTADRIVFVQHTDACI